MDLPVLTAEQKLFIRDQQLALSRTQIEITNIQTKAKNDIQFQQQKSVEVGTQLRVFVEAIAKQNGLEFDKVTFDMDTLTFAEKSVPVAPAPVDSANAAAPTA